MAKEAFHVIIIGAGSTGLLIAQGLAASSISYSIYERQDPNTYDERQRNWTMALHWGSEHIKSLLPPALVAELPNIEPDPQVNISEIDETSFPILNGQTGEVIVRISAATTRRANKEKMRKLFSTGIQIQHGKRLVDIVEDGNRVRAKFADGTEAVGDALVGCDAGQSVVRSWLLGEEKAALDVVPLEFYNVVQQYNAEQARFIRHERHPLIKIMLHPKKPLHFVLVTNDIPDESDPTAWKFQMLISHWGAHELATSAERVARIKELTADIAEPFRTAAQYMDADAPVVGDHITHWARATPWPNCAGRVTLAGDAAHCLTPFRGQGLNNALADAAVYVGAMRSLLVRGDGDGAGGSAGLKAREDVAPAALRAAVDAYDAEVFARGKREIDTSALQVRVAHTWDEYMASPIVKQGLHNTKG